LLDDPLYDEQKVVKSTGVCGSASDAIV